MALGVYYNPTWISPAAVKNKEILVKGTNIPVREITDLSYVYNGENEKKITGDRFSYPNGELFGNLLIHDFCQSAFLYPFHLRTMKKQVERELQL